MRISAERRSRIHLQLVIEVRTIDRQVTGPPSHLRRHDCSEVTLQSQAGAGCGVGPHPPASSPPLHCYLSCQPGTDRS